MNTIVYEKLNYEKVQLLQESHTNVRQIVWRWQQGKHSLMSLNAIV